MLNDLGIVCLEVVFGELARVGKLLLVLSVPQLSETETTEGRWLTASKAPICSPTGFFAGRRIDSSPNILWGR